MATTTAPPEPFYLLGQQFAIDLPGARVMFTTRRGGFSRGPYKSLNLGRLTGDEPGAVTRNRDKLESELRVQLAFVHQVHGTNVCELTAQTAAVGRVAGVGELTRADGQYTVQPGLAPTALTADCLPIAIAGEGAAAMLHGGWRGLAGGVIAAGVRGLREAGAAGPLSAAIGPGAGGCCYEVGPDVHDAFADHPEHVHLGPNLDLAAAARFELTRAGVRDIHELGMCTICSDPSLFFSHRRDHGVTGRQAGVAWLTG
jgi:purine-nucleoside/S-methyl-5'-thioadenosine phosphorylase / adenosine deaminase